MNEDIGKRGAMKLLTERAVTKDPKQWRAERLKTGGSTRTSALHGFHRSRPHGNRFPLTVHTVHEIPESRIFVQYIEIRPERDVSDVV